MSPLIVTLTLDPESQSQLDSLREQYFPPERNFIQAHVTLFHALDGEREAEIVADLNAITQTRFEVTASRLRSLGHGVAIDVTSPQLQALHAGLARRWAPMLTAQDAQAFHPHVTIQNKVDPAEARALLAAWQPIFAPYSMEATGLSLWRYLGGPWEPVTTIPFQVQ